MTFTGLAALLLVILAIALVVRGWDVRLVLLAAALLIAGLAGFDRSAADWSVPLAAVVRTFLETFSNEKFVVPICAAMGFAYVLRHTGCERHLVLLLVKPLRTVRFLLVPGVVCVGFLVNVPVISQTSTAVCLGPVVVPLMRSAGYSLATIGACLLLGASVGGELLNPGAPELLTVESKTGVSTRVQARSYLPPLVFVQLAVSVLVCWLLSRRWERKLAESPPAATGGLDDPPRINVLKACVPLVPLLLLFASAPPLHLFEIPQHWVVNRPPELANAAASGVPLATAAEAKKDGSYNTRLIGLAMLVGVLVAMAATRDKARDCVKTFFEGAGYGYANVVSLIVIANCFGKAIESAGLAQSLGRLIAAFPDLMQPLAALVPLAFAAISGSGMASTQSLYGFFHGPAVALGLDPVAVGALVAVGSAAGRTMSPVAAVCLMCGTLTGTNPFVLAKRMAVPLLSGIAVVIALRMTGVL